MATGTMSSRPLSTMARNTRRPMRPNPLMATLTAIEPSSHYQLVISRFLTALATASGVMPKCRKRASPGALAP